MILATDVHYLDSTAKVAGVLFDIWDANAPTQEVMCQVDHIEPYESGSFFKRELPCILALLEKHRLEVDCIVVDGYVFLGNQSKLGLGKYLYDALDERVSVIGVAKTPFVGICDQHELFRGKSEKPLYVTTTDSLTTAKQNVSNMHGDFRIPTLLKRVDQLCRE